MKTIKAIYIPKYSGYIGPFFKVYLEVEFRVDINNFIIEKIGRLPPVSYKPIERSWDFI